MLRNVLLLSTSVIFAFCLTLAADRLVGALQPMKAAGVGLIFPPAVKHVFRTKEFSYQVETNSLGFRGGEPGLRKSTTARILAIGDSFTFGWGVEETQSWSKLLETRLRLAGHDLEVANLGMPGGSPRNYADIAETAIPLLRPDVVIVAVLQGDDLAQMDQDPKPHRISDLAERTDLSAAYPRLRRLALHLYPHLLDLLNEAYQPDLSERWKADAKYLLANMDPAARDRFSQLDEKIRKAFTDGEINPVLVQAASSFPDYFLSTMDASTPRSERLTQEMAIQLSRIRDAARDNNARTVVVAVPYGVYVSERSFRTRQQLGLQLSAEMLTTDAADQPIRRASEIAGLPFYTVTDEFRRVSRQRDLFFELDGHFNAAGHETFAAALAPTIADTISRAPIATRPQP